VSALATEGGVGSFGIGKVLGLTVIAMIVMTKLSSGSMVGADTSQ